ncbi:MAG: triose-phosphate isomerase [Candidatus Omnitrophica bacterium]|nr:triose-phosphate isomerase [Candidatus Omnitrophota bacterium]MDD5429525.1 triose-phosphate isomerase [Candidatus Omnitrophota bacterium]
MRQVFIAGNWKLNKSIKEAIELVTELKRDLIDIEAADIVVCPVFTALSDVSDVIIDSNIKLGAQDVYWQESGAFTGEVSSTLLKDAGCTYVIIGHSERRKYFFETDETVNKKIKAAQNAELIPIVCVGETLEERESGKTMEVIKGQLQGSLQSLDNQSLQALVIAYEPVWAIGTGKTATSSQAQEVHGFIRNWLIERCGSPVSQKIRILYGGSVKPSNIKELIQEPDIDGALVGGASLERETFSQIVKNAL